MAIIIEVVIALTSEVISVSSAVTEMLWSIPQDVQESLPNEDAKQFPVRRERNLVKVNKMNRHDREKHPVFWPCIVNCNNIICSELTDDTRKEVWDDYEGFLIQLGVSSCIKIKQFERRTVQQKNQGVLWDEVTSN